MDNISLHEFTKNYKKLKKNNDNSIIQIDDTMDKLTFYMQSVNQDKTKCHLSREEYIEGKLRETMCLCSIYFGIEYDLQFHSESESSSANA